MALKILVVDDEQNIVDILESNLLREGYEVLVAYDGCRDWAGSGGKAGRRLADTGKRAPQ